MTIPGTHITNTREAKAFALLSEEGISKGIRRVTAVTTECAFDALNAASLLEREVEDASRAEGSALEKVFSLSLSTIDKLRRCRYLDSRKTYCVRICTFTESFCFEKPSRCSNYPSS